MLSGGHFHFTLICLKLLVKWKFSLCVECYIQDECEEVAGTGSTYVEVTTCRQKRLGKHRNVNSDHLCVVIPSMELQFPKL